MHFSKTMGIASLILSTSLCLLGQTESKGIPPRAAPADYQVQGKAGDLTVAAEFTGHSFPTSEGPLTSEEYVGVEVALFGASGAQSKIAAADFSLRVNGKKAPLPSQPFGLVVSSLKDPEYVPPEGLPERKSKSSVGTGGQGDSNAPAAPVKIPLPVQRAMAQRLQKAALPEGDRALPQAGLIFFQLRTKEKNIQSVELLYEGPAGKATLKLQ